MIQPCRALIKREGPAARENKPALPKVQMYCKGSYIGQTLDAGGITNKNKKEKAGALSRNMNRIQNERFKNKIEIAQLAPVAKKSHKKKQTMINPGTTCSLKEKKERNPPDKN
jgi:hypothetical protein